MSIKLPKGRFAYARVLPKLVAFYSVFSDEEHGDLEWLTRSRIAFVVPVHRDAFKSPNWRAIGYLPLHDALLQDVLFFRILEAGKFSIYVSVARPKDAYREYDASAEMCAGLEPLAVWDAEQIEERLSLLSCGVLHPFVESERARLSLRA